MSIPPQYSAMRGEQPGMALAYEAFGRACSAAGPLDAKTVALVKLAISLGAGLEGAAHSHVRKALEAGCSREEVLHVAHLCGPTIGWPGMMRGRGWVLDVVDAKDAAEKTP
jgi:4-carboxymuconolactone decarboxylase